jgi:hypothetical protein
LVSPVLSHSHHAVIRVYDEAGDVIEAHEHKGDFKESYDSFCLVAGNDPWFLRRSGGRRTKGLDIVRNL